MKKIPTIFLRDDKMKMTRTPNPVCDWVFAGQGVALRKFDGTCCLIRDGKIYKRRQINQGDTIPDEFEFIDADPITGKQYGWMPVNSLDSADRYHIEAFSVIPALLWRDGTYELCGPKVQGNPEGFLTHKLIHHSIDPEHYSNVPTDYDNLKAWLAERDIEGIVWHVFDGSGLMAKIKKSDYGLKRKL